MEQTKHTTLLNGMNSHWNRSKNGIPIHKSLLTKPVRHIDVISYTIAGVNDHLELKSRYDVMLVASKMAGL